MADVPHDSHPWASPEEGLVNPDPRRHHRTLAPAVDLSVVIPVFNEEDSLTPLHESLTSVLHELGKPYEVIYVDAGSTDGSWEGLKKIAARDRRVRLIRLRKNFGQTSALAAGFAHSLHHILITLDADLQNDPGDIPRQLLAEHAAGRRDHRKKPYTLLAFQLWASRYHPA